MLEEAGFEVIDPWEWSPLERFVEAIREHQLRFIGMSVLLTATMPGMRTTIEALQEAGLGD